jgi:hypothetical protein
MTEVLAAPVLRDSSSMRAQGVHGGKKRES